MTDQTWIVFFREATDEKRPDSFVVVDQATIDPEVGEQFPMIEIISTDLPVSMLSENGYPMDTAADALNGAEDAAFGAIDENQCRLIARVTQPGRRRWILCHTLTGKRDMGRFAEVLSTHLQVAATSEPAAWEEVFWVYPDRFEASDYWNWQIIATLQQNGDNCDAPRPITHFMYDVEPDKEKTLRRTLEQYGYTVDGFTDGRMVFSRVAPIVTEEINRETRALHLMSDEFDCGYDGWETQVVPTGQA